MGQIFELGPDHMWNIAVVGTQPGISPRFAVSALLEMGDNVLDELSARRVLRELPKQVRVKGQDLERFKSVFETVEWFHHERVVNDWQMNDRNVWVTRRDPDADVEMLFMIAEGLLLDERWGGFFRNCQIIKRLDEEDVMITFDRRP